MENKEIKKILIEQKEDYKRFLGIAIEYQNSQMKLLSESLLENSRKIDRNAEMIGKNAENISIIKTDVQFIKQGLGQKVDKDEFDVLEKRVMFLEKKLNAN